jgi:hypothetical protein
MWQRKGFWIVAGSIGALLLVVGLLSRPQAVAPTAATASTAVPTTSALPALTTTAAPPTTVQTATVQGWSA